MVTHPPVKLLRTMKRKDIKTKKEEKTTTAPQAGSQTPQPKTLQAEKRFDKDQGGASTSKSEPPTTTAEKLCVEKIDPNPVVKGDGQRQDLPEIPGLSKDTAAGLARRHGVARLLEVASLSKDKKNPAGWARAALENGWLTTPPAVAVDTKKNEEYKELMTLWEAMPEAERRRAYLRGGGFGSPEMPNPLWLKKFFHDQAGRKAM